jgi:SPP1 gp7 family putative phage head morphogenesis protein
MALNSIFKQQVLIAHGGNVKVKKRIAKWLYPNNAERIYERELVKLFKELDNKIKDILYPQLEFLVAQANSTRPDNKNLKLDSWEDDIEEIYNNIQSNYNSIISSIIGVITFSQATRISNYNKQQLDKIVYSAVKVNPILSEYYLNSQIRAFVKNNSSLITKLSDGQAKRMEETLFRNLSAGNSVKVIKEEIEKGFKIGERRARLIARDQTNKFNGNLTQLRQKELGIGEYWWSTSLDERVRQTHKSNEGKIFNWDKPSAITGHPGSQIRCRCVAQPIISSKMFD